MNTRFLLLAMFGITANAFAAEPIARGLPPVSRPRAEAYIPGLSAATAPILRASATATPTPELPKFPDSADILFYAKARPIRVRVTVGFAGQSTTQRWETHLKNLFTAFDRDRDGVLNRFELEHIFPASGFQQMLRGGTYYRNPSMAFSPSDVDRDGDGRVPFAEFAAYYTTVATGLLRTQPIAGGYQTQDQMTRELFARLDSDKSKSLSKIEATSAERLLLTLDTDEDECVSVQELLTNANAAIYSTAVAPPVGMGGMTRAQMLPQDIAVFQDGVPGTVVQELLKRYDRNADFELTRDEIGWDAGTFSRMDRNTSGKLSATELDEWRLGEPDGVVEIMLAENPVDSRVRATAANGKSPILGVEVRQTESNRAVLRLGTQTLDIGASVPVNRYDMVRNTVAGAFPQGRDVVREADLVGPQYQLIRILFDSADFNTDGKLTREEVEKYYRLQQQTTDIGMSVVFLTRTPNLFQLLDENGDGRLSVRELRTAWDRLIVLEPGSSQQVTEAVMQPAATVRVGQGRNAFSDPSVYAGAYSGVPQQRAAPQGPLWFRKMDRNRDGDVSRTEFLGSLEDFAKIDVNHDDLISQSEAEKFAK